MLLAPDRFFKPESGTETLLLQTIGIRDLVLGSGACAALLRGGGGEFRRWATLGLVSDSADLLLGLRSRPLVGTKSALIATLAPVPFVGAAVFAFVRSLRAPEAGALSRRQLGGPRTCRPWFPPDPGR
jgi:hypothetical protein